MSADPVERLIRPEWRERLQYAASVPLSELIDPKAKVTGTLRGDTGRVTSEDLEALANTGLPQIEGCLYPEIEPDAVERERGLVFRLGSYDDGFDIITGQAAPLGPEHLFVVEAATGSVAKLSRARGVYWVPASTSIQRFVEMAWRYYHLVPVLSEMVYSGSEVPFAEPDEHAAVKQAAWSAALKVDPGIAEYHPYNFWRGAIWDYQ